MNTPVQRRRPPHTCVEQANSLILKRPRVEQANSLFLHRLFPPRADPTLAEAGATLVLRWGALVIAFLVFPVVTIAQDAAPAQPTEQVEPSDDEQFELKPTELGIRFTPKMSAAISNRFVEQMKSRYELDDQQADEITEVMQRQFMKFAGDNAALGRDMIELMTSTMIENDGRFPKDEATEFAAMANRFMPRFKEFITQSSAQIGKKMTVRQRLKYTADVSVFAAGLITFENRMKRWEEGKIGDNANPFFDPADTDPAKTAPEPIDPRETEAHRKARKNVEQWIDRTINRDKQWADYVDRAAKYYDFSEVQITAARAILKDCQQRALAIRTPEWQQLVKEIQIAQNLTRGATNEISEGPWSWSLNEAHATLLKPLNDLADELKRRIDELPDSNQRAAAREKVRKALVEKGVKQLPT